LLHDLGETGESVPRYAKALRLSLYMLRHGMEVEGWDVRARVLELQKALEPYEPDTETMRAIWQWHEAEGRLADAENTLYELADKQAVTKAEGDEFYERMAACDDDALEAGELTREELEEGRRQWSALMKEK